MVNKYSPYDSHYAHINVFYLHNLGILKHDICINCTYSSILHVSESCVYLGECCIYVIECRVLFT